MEHGKNNDCMERAKTAYTEQSSGSPRQGVTLIGDKCENNRALTLLSTRKILTRSNDLLGQSSTEKLIDMLKEHAGLKECTEETVNHINSVSFEFS